MRGLANQNEENSEELCTNFAITKHATMHEPLTTTLWAPHDITKNTIKHRQLSTYTYTCKTHTQYCIQVNAARRHVGRSQNLSVLQCQCYHSLPMAQRLKHPCTNSVIIDQLAKLFRSAIMHVCAFFSRDKYTHT